MIVSKAVSRHARCVFKGGCNHAPATHVAIHEFVNYPPKPLCEIHAAIVKNLTK